MPSGRIATGRSPPGRAPWSPTPQARDSAGRRAPGTSAARPPGRGGGRPCWPAAAREGAARRDPRRPPRPRAGSPAGSHRWVTVTRLSRRTAWTASICSMHSGSLRSTTSKQASAVCSALASHDTACSGETAEGPRAESGCPRGASSPAQDTGSVNGYGATWAPEPVSGHEATTCPRSAGRAMGSVPRPRGESPAAGRRGPRPASAARALREFLDATLDVALEVVGPLVLRNHAQHLPQPTPGARWGRAPCGRRPRRPCTRA